MRNVGDGLRAWGAGIHPRRVHYGWLALTLAIGVVGAMLFLWARLPLPWMLGPMILAMVLALGGAPVVIPNALRSPMLIVLGVLIGSTTTPELIAHVPEWSVSLLGLLGVIIVGTALCYFYFRRLAGYDRPTAYFASIPGGLTEMILLSEANEGDSRFVALSHAVRVSIVVLTVPFVVQLMSGMVLGACPPSGMPFSATPIPDLLWFAATCIVAALLAGQVRSATALFLVPLLVSTLLHASGLAPFAVPREMGIAAQLVIGLSLGCRFRGMQLRRVGTGMLWATGASIILIGVALLFAFLLEQVTGQNRLALLLAYSPGGVAEMSLVALAAHLEVAFVVLNHLTRLAFVTLAARAVFALAIKAKPSP